MKKTCLIGFMAAIALMAAGTLVNAEINPVANSDFEADYTDANLYAPFTAWTDFGGESHILLENLWGASGNDIGPGAMDQNWMTIASDGAAIGGIYQDLGTTEATGFYVAQSLAKPHQNGDPTTTFKFSLRKTDDTELSSVQNANCTWVVPGGLINGPGSPTVLVETTWTATSAVDLRIQMESVTSANPYGRLSTDDYYVVNELHGANTPNPTRWALEVPINGSLQWATGDTGTITGYEVFLGAAPDELVSQGTTTSTSFPVSLNYNAIYYWRVDTQTTGGTITGTIWAFRTVLALPVIDTQPTDAGGLPGEDVTFTVGATDPSGTGLSYQWYNDPNTLLPGDEVALTNGADYSGVTTATLTVHDIDETDSGKTFFCAVTNAAGTVNTNLVTVSVAGLVHYIPFEASFDDVKGSGNLVETIGDPDYETGIVGQALSLDDGTDGTYGALKYENIWPIYTDDDAASGWFSPTTAGGWGTVSLWVKSYDNTRPYGAFFMWLNGGYSTPWMGQQATPGYIRFRELLIAGNDTVWHDIDYANVVENDQWTFLVLRMDKHETTLFVNGVPHMRSPHDGKVAAYFSSFDFYIGKIDWASQTGPSGWFYGAIDEFKVYNYPLTDVQIAQEYADISGSSVCVLGNPANIVEEGNCAVDLADFAALAASWLQDLNIYPNP